MTFRPHCFGIMLVMLAVQPALAQIKPASSGDLSFHEPEMRRHGSGLYRPNRPQHRRHHRRHAFFR